MATIIDGKKIAADIRAEIKSEADIIKEKTGKEIGIAVVLVGDDPASAVYVRNKIKACADTGITSFEFRLQKTTTERELLDLINRLNADSTVNGILVQLPLPSGINENLVINTINPVKDVDCFHPVNVGKMLIGEEGFYPCTPAGCQELINRTVPDLKGKHLVVIGRSNIVGKPMTALMLQKNSRANCTVTICHTGTKDIGYFTKQADIIVSAAGKYGTLTSSMVKPGAVVIDVGMNRIDDPANPGKTKLAGDVVFDEVAEVASAITPVPGGVGPMTIAMLLKNTLMAFKMQNNY
jgi:methylenetetrahydrofolate dehydrogenase (NADP+)/methenyltetrahydrofolate cyclohydrolase